MCIGHNVVPSIGIVDYMEDNDLRDKIEVCGLCCTATDTTRYFDQRKNCRPDLMATRFIRSGVADVVVLDEQCIRTDAFQEAQKVKAPVIAASEKNCVGLPNRTNDPADEIVEDLVSGKAPGVLILDPEKVGEVAVKVALKVAPIRKKFKALPETEDIIKWQRPADSATCANALALKTLKIPEAMSAAAGGSLAKLAELYESCVGCGRCEHACPVDIEIHSFIIKAGEKQMREEKYTCRAGRGAIQDMEIRNVGAPIVLGEIPGVVAVVGCANYPKGGVDVTDICREFAKRRYIVVTIWLCSYVRRHVQEL